MAAEHVEVRVEARGDATLVRVVGVLDAVALPEVSRELTNAQRGPGEVIVDLEAVTFMDSRGLGALLAANERAREGAPAVRIYRPSDPVQRLLDVSGVRGVLLEVEELPAA
jgi:anti-sigma B factor antagonist